jgi:UDPglucose 6-dehydrogenase
MNLCIIGSGYVGLVTGACFAEVGHHVICVDNDPRKIECSPWGASRSTSRGSKISSTATSPPTGSSSPAASRKGWTRSEVVFIAVPTPPQPDGSVDLSFIEKVAREIASVLKADYRSSWTRAPCR